MAGCFIFFFFCFQAEDGIRDIGVTGVQTCALPISARTLPPVAPAVLRTLRAALASTGRWSVRLLVVVAVLAFAVLAAGPHLLGYRTMTMRSEERRVGREGRTRWAPDNLQKKNNSTV